MKTTITFLFVLLLAFNVFGQTKATVVKNVAVIKQKPNSKAKTIHIIKKGEVISLENSKPKGNWYELTTLKGNFKGWIKDTEIKLLTAKNQWYEVPTLDENYQFYINPYQIIKENGNVLFWLKRRNLKFYDYQLSHQEVICEQKKWRSIEFVNYDRNGNVVKAGSYNEVAFKTVIPDSQIDIIVRYICEEKGEVFGKVPDEYIGRGDSHSEKSNLEGIVTRVGSMSDDRPPIPDTISGGVLNSKALSLPKPIYPEGARQYRASGAVNVLVKINHEGKVVEAKAVSGHESLRQVSEAAALQATFLPTTLSGKKVNVTGVIVYNFVP